MSSVLKNIIIEFLKENPKYIATNIFFMSLIPLNDVYVPKLYGQLFESIQNNVFTMDKIIHILVMLSIIQVGNALMDINDSTQIPLFQQKCKSVFLKRIFDDQKEHYKDLTGSDMLSRILRSQHIFTAWYSKLTTFILPHILEFAGTLIYFFTIDVQIGIGFSILLLICTFVLFVSPYQTAEHTAKSDKALMDVHQEIDDVLTNNISVHKENKIEYELKRLGKKNNKFIQLYNISVKASLSYRFLLTGSLIAFIFFFTFRCYALLKTDKIAKSLFFSLIMIISHLIGNVLWINDIARDAMFDFGSISNASFLQPKSPKKIEIDCVDEEANSPTKHIELRNINFKYENSKDLTLKNINLSIHKGVITIITGEIGSGKSTLAKLILRLLEPNEGTLLLNGKCYSTIPLDIFYKDVGVMPQNCVLFNRSILENIRYDNENVTETKVVDTLNTFGIMKHFSKLQDGIHTLAGKHGNNLSGGQRQLVWILKLYFKNPSIILMDEPTASIDKNTKQLFKRIVKHMLNTKTIIIITHDSEIQDIGDREVVVRNGMVTSDEEE